VHPRFDAGLTVSPQAYTARTLLIMNPEASPCNTHDRSRRSSGLGYAKTRYLRPDSLT